MVISAWAAKDVVAEVRGGRVSPGTATRDSAGFARDVRYIFVLVTT